VLTSELSDVARRPEGVVWSADGSQALFYSLSGRWIQRGVGLPDAARFESAIDLSSLGGTVAAVAADPTAARIAVAIQGDSTGVYVMDGDRDFVTVRPAGKPIALAFSEDGRKLYILDGDPRQVSEISLGDSNSRDCSIDGLQDPIAIQVAHDATNRPVLYVAARGDRMVRTYDIPSLRVLANTPLDFEPIAIEAFGRHSFLLRPRFHDDDPLWCLTSVPQSMVYFVPATPLTSERTE
jgi:DNA-binding beta-propeller fold protein YncE